MGGLFGSLLKKDTKDNRKILRRDIFRGTDYHITLARRLAGVVVQNSKGCVKAIHEVSKEYFRPKFKDDLRRMNGYAGMGVFSDSSAQPLMYTYKNGSYAIAAVCQINNLKKLKKEQIGKGRHFAESKNKKINEIELIAYLIEEGKDFEEGIQNAQEQIKGSCSILFLTEEGMYVARDKLGRIPLVIGEKEEAYSVATETCGFPNLGYAIDYFKFLGPGEIVLIHNEGIAQIKPSGNKMQFCIFHPIYYMFPESYYMIGRNAEDFRYKNGELMAEHRILDNIDFITDIPDTATDSVAGYAKKSGIEHKRGLIKFTASYGRSFLKETPDSRDEEAHYKIIVNSKAVKGKKVGVGDDSWVRGTQSKRINKKLKDAGAIEAHFTLSCPPLVEKCLYLNFTRLRSSKDLAARKAMNKLEKNPNKHFKEYITPGTDRYNAMVEVLRSESGLDSVNFQTLENIIKASGMKKEDLCTHCFDGSGYF